jgi:two-component system cell cycle response regulator DivK
MKKILVAEDNAASREFLGEFLSSCGYTVVEASNGEEALARTTQEMPDLLLLDIQMPVLDGYTVLRRLRADPRFARLRVVAFTAYAMPGDKEKALAAGFDGYITKPIRTATLREQITQLLD